MTVLAQMSLYMRHRLCPLDAPEPTSKELDVQFELQAIAKEKYPQLFLASYPDVAEELFVDGVPAGKQDALLLDGLTKLLA